MIRALALIAVTMVVALHSYSFAPEIRAQEGGLGGSGSISGTLRFPDGSPAARKILEWRPAGNIDGGSTAVTDADGNYQITGLRPGLYYVGFFEPSRLPSDQNSGIEEIHEGAPRIPGRAIPVGKKLLLQNGEALAGVDFVITNIGDESIEGPETNGVSVGALPGTGADTSMATTSEDGEQLLSRSSIISIGLVVMLAGVGLLGLRARRWSDRR